MAGRAPQAGGTPLAHKPCMDDLPNLPQYEAALAAALSDQPPPPAITGYGLVSNRRLVCGVGDLAEGGRGIPAYRVAQFPLRPGLELVVVFVPTPDQRRPHPQAHMAQIERCLDRLRALDRASG